MSVQHNPLLINDSDMDFLRNTQGYTEKYYNLLLYRFDVECHWVRTDLLEKEIANFVTDVYYMKTLTKGTFDIPAELEVRFTSKQDAFTFKMMDWSWLTIKE